MLDQVQKVNSDPTIPMLIVGGVMLLVGIACFFFPAKVRQYDTRMTRLIKDESDYLFSVKLFGAIFLLISIFIFLAFVGLVILPR